MKKIFIVCILVFILTSCSIGWKISDFATETHTGNISQTSSWISQWAYEIWTVDTAFKLIGPDHKIEVGAVPDNKIAWITCFYSRAKKWWITGGLWIAEDTSDASVSCRQTWKITFHNNIGCIQEIQKPLHLS
jgi:catabolite regulation protein CreA